MSNIPFIESQSEDPTEQAIARKVHRILNDTSLDRQQRENLVRRAQRDLLEHRRHKEQQRKLLEQVGNLAMPKGFRAQSIQVRDGQVQVGALNHRSSFVWLEAGEAPTGVAVNRPSFLLPRQSQGGGTKVRKDGVAERRKAAEAHKT